jgi:hypothetical protein
MDWTNICCLPVFLLGAALEFGMSRKHQKSGRYIGTQNAFKSALLSNVVIPMMSADSVPAWVGIDNLSTGTPTVDVIVPSSNGLVTLAEFKRAARDHYFILNLFSPDMRQWLQFLLSETQVEFFYREPHDPSLGELKG